MRSQMAAAKGHEDAVMVLLDAGAAMTVQDLESGYTALHRAFLCCKLASAAALVRAGASVHEPRCHEGLSPLELLHKTYGRVPSGALQAPPGEVYTWGDAGSAGTTIIAHACDPVRPFSATQPRGLLSSAIITKSA